MANQTLEELFEGLETVIGTMEQPEVSLEESFQLYHRGMELLKSCNNRLDKIEKKMLVLDDEGEMHEFEE
ncbi:exodeoxyribonuclease VII small subunit [Lachnospiraceae bacterium 48-42]|jgi:Exonuclease VII small subunit